MPQPMLVPREHDRRQYPRRTCRVPLAIETLDGGTSIPCESIDVSIGGMQVRSSSRVPLGPCDVVIAAEADDLLVLRGDVVEERIDVSTGQVTARIVFVLVPATAQDRLATLPDQGAILPRQGRRRGATLLAAGVAAVLVVAAGGLVASREADDGTGVPAAAVAPQPQAPQVAPLDAPPTAPAPADGEIDDAPPTAPAPADNTVRVVLSSSPEETAVLSSVEPSEGVDQVRVQLHVTPDQDGTVLPVAVTLENRGENTLTFPSGFRAILTATRDGAVLATATLTASDVTEAAPGEVVAAEGLFDFGAFGEYDVTADVDVTG